MNEFLRSNESLTDEELLICEEASRLWEENCNDEKEGTNRNGYLQKQWR